MNQLTQFGNQLGDLFGSTSASTIQELSPFAFKGSNITRLAGLSGAVMVLMAHLEEPMCRHNPDARPLHHLSMEVHGFYTVVLLATPLTRRPQLTASLLSLGIVLFSGPGYVNTFTGRTTHRLFPVAGALFLAAWLSMAI